MPFSIIGSTEDVATADGRVVKGREYLWGIAEGVVTPFTLVILGLRSPRFRSREREPLRFQKIAILFDPHAYA